jgi:hypothetical protein
MLDPLHARLEIARVDCALLDAVLTFTFDPRELANLVGSETCACPRGVVSLAHRACHEDEQAARRLERVLDRLHGREVKRLAEMGLEAWSDEALEADERTPELLGGRIWALATCDEPGAAALRRSVGRALFLDGLLAIRDRGCTAGEAR